MSPVTQNGLVIDDSLYDGDLLKRIDISKSRTKFDPPISVTHPGESLLVRPLALADYDRGFIQLLGQLTEVGEISREQFQKRFEMMKSCPDTYYVTVIEDTNTNQVVGCATLVVEQKFIHGCAVLDMARISVMTAIRDAILCRSAFLKNLVQRGRLEDVVVSDEYRGKQLGKLIITVITLLAEELGCYKITLDCKDKMIPFYSNLGYKIESGSSNYMQIRFEKS